MKKLRGEAWLQSNQKRCEDLVLTALMAPVAVPAIGAAALAVRFYDKVEPFFVHERLGANDVPFRIRKVRTLPKAVEHHPGVAGHKHPEASKLGSFLRKMRIDEAPQFSNILQGTMSVVGPRPLTGQDFETARHHLSPVDYEQWRQARTFTKPGLVDLFAIRFYRDEFADDLDRLWQHRAEAGIEYADTASRRTDHFIMRQAGLLAASFLKPALEPQHE
jgi:lipopolysaccharide/colanic/teichoic acid biosynthesis glycosyltransferase